MATTRWRCIDTDDPRWIEERKGKIDMNIDDPKWIQDRKGKIKMKSREKVSNRKLICSFQFLFNLRFLFKDVMSRFLIL